ncbi:MAG: hypothetical protein HY881_13550 [Deltaproteobacteria bacterium]|nr:hypothetical protein [Deltaproteobacteria bacterium]
MNRLGPEREVTRKIIFSAQQNPKRIVLPEGNHPTILRAAHQVARKGIAIPRPDYETFAFPTRVC